MLKILSSVVLFVVVCAKPAWQELDNYTFEDYVKDFGLNVSKFEYLTKKEIFEQEVEVIRNHNRDSTATFKLNVNKFTLLSKAEMKKFKGYNKAQARSFKAAAPSATVEPNTTAFPITLDWRTKGATTAVKNQESCGSCWAFATTESVESAVQIATGKLLTLSPQQITSCTPNPDNCGGSGGCQGATAELGLGYIHKNGGLATDASYPYTAGGGDSGKCKNSTSVATVGGFVKNKENDLDGLMAAVQLGPVSISVDASWNAYDSGIYDACSKDADIDHAVQLVGYGEEGGTKYWIVRNSWGEDWGEKGYIRIKRFDSSDAYCGTDSNPLDGSGCAGGPTSVKVCGMCAILYDTTYPTGAKLVNAEDEVEVANM